MLMPAGFAKAFFQAVDTSVSFFVVVFSRADHRRCIGRKSAVTLAAALATVFIAAVARQVVVSGCGVVFSAVTVALRRREAV